MFTAASATTLPWPPFLTGKTATPWYPASLLPSLPPTSHCPHLRKRELRHQIIPLSCSVPSMVPRQAWYCQPCHFILLWPLVIAYSPLAILDPRKHRHVGSRCWTLALAFLSASSPTSSHDLFFRSQFNCFHLREVHTGHLIQNRFRSGVMLFVHMFTAHSSIRV